MALAQFRIFSADDFESYLQTTHFSRLIKVIQNHHTWKPGYTHLTTQRGEMYWLESMRQVHINDRKWSDIGQHITTFPSGNIALCRPIDLVPAGIRGANTGGICIEHFGNFDIGGDEMTLAHGETIIRLNAMLCKRFQLQPNKKTIVYHHWYDQKGVRFSDEKINNHQVLNEQKSCPGTAFFGGNTIRSAEENFFPLIQSAMEQPFVGPVITATKKIVKVSALNVRSGPDKNQNILRIIQKDTEVLVYQERNGWSKISNTAEEWVYSSLLSDPQ